MKKLLGILLIVLLVIPFMAEAQTWVGPNQSTIGWDAVTTLENGDPIPEGGVIKYDIYLKNYGAEGNGEKLGTTEALQYTVTFPGEGDYVVGVGSVRFEGDEQVGESIINWSDVNGESTPNPFAYRVYAPPSAPKGLKTQ